MKKKPKIRECFDKAIETYRSTIKSDICGYSDTLVLIVHKSVYDRLKVKTHRGFQIVYTQSHPKEMIYFKSLFK